MGPGGLGLYIVLITVDTLRFDATSEMESFRRLGGASAIQAPFPWTLPSMASLFTGLEVAQHGAGRRADRSLSASLAEHSTLAERLSAAGWETAAVVAPNPFLGRAFGLERGFDHVDHLRDETSHALPWGQYQGGVVRPAGVAVDQADQCVPAHVGLTWPVVLTGVGEGAQVAPVGQSVAQCDLAVHHQTLVGVVSRGRSGRRR